MEEFVKSIDECQALRSVSAIAAAVSVLVPFHVSVFISVDLSVHAAVSTCKCLFLSVCLFVQTNIFLSVLLPHFCPTPLNLKTSK